MLTETVDSPSPEADAREATGTSRRAWRVDAAVLAGYLVLALAITARLGRDLDHRYLVNSVSDQYGFEWYIGMSTRAFTRLENPLFTDLLNAPLGVNVMAQTSILGLVLPLVPVTVLAGPEVTFAVLLVTGLAGTAAAWYWVFSRHATDSRLAAAIGGGLCGFAPPMISHASGGHLNFINLFVLPFIALGVVRLREPGRWLRNGVVLGLLIAWQVFIGEEPLLLAALGLGTFVLAYAALRPAEARTAWRPFLAGLAVATGVAVALVAYPLWYQFRGPQSYGDIPHLEGVGNDVFSLTTFASQSLGGGHPVARLAMNPTEENGFFGWPLLVLAAVAAVWLWRSSVPARAAAITAGIFLWASLGSTITITGKDTHIPGLWRPFASLPLIGSVLASRLAFVAIPAIALLLVLATARVLELARGAEGAGVPVRLLWFGALAAALLPVAPTPVPTVPRPAAPAFFASGAWRDHIPVGGTILPVPPADGSFNRPSRWPIAAGMDIALADGYFVGPHGADRHGWYGAERRPTADLLYTIAQTGRAEPVTDEQRRAAREDIRFWRLDALVLDPHHPRGAQLRDAVDQLVGPGRRVADVWLWDVRGLR